MDDEEERKCIVIDNSKRIELLESRMKGVESTLLEIKNALVEGRKQDPGQVGYRPKTQEEKWNLLSDVERNKIDNIMENFDFDKVQSVMDYLDWKWVGTKNGIPTIDEIRDEAKRMLIDAAFEETPISCGGLKVTYENDDENPDDPFIQLEFILTDCEGFDESEFDERKDDGGNQDEN